MATKANWQPGSTVCRCCFAEGCYKDISTEYFWMGKREVYSEMLLDTFDVSISYALSGPNSNSRLICEPCISRLRDATDFKRQVQECERTFMTHLNPVAVASTSVEALPESEKEELKLEQIKVEIKLDEPNYDDDDHAFQDDDDDDMDDQPLTALASKVPKKETMDLSDLLDNAKPEKLKRKIATKAKASPAKKAKKEVKPSASKAKEDDKKKKASGSDPARVNAETLIRYTTAYPFRVNDKSMLCVYCHELYTDPTKFREHMTEEHETFSLYIAFSNIPKSEFIKADCTELKCRICDTTLDNLDDAATHLTTHSKNIDLKSKLGVMPYVLKKDVFNCAICDKNFPSLFHLNRHTITHFLTYVCHVCGRSYLASTGLFRHVRSKHQDYEVSCKKCGKKFPTMEAKERHRRTEKACMPYCCPKCPERFIDYKLRKRHMETQHGLEQKSVHCVDCNTYFAGESAYYEHYKLQHSQDCSVCKHCGMKFTSLYRLKRHMKRHNLQA